MLLVVLAIGMYLIADFGNHVRENRTDGIYIYSKASDTVLSENIIAGNLRYGIYVKSEDNRIADGNQVFGNSVGIYLNVKKAPEISRESNQIYDNLEEDVRREPALEQRVHHRVEAAPVS